MSNPVHTLETKRTPVRDGASGLHYSGRVYDNQYRTLTASNMCDGTTATNETITVPMPDSISTTQSLATREAVGAYVKSLGSKIPGSTGDFDQQASADANLYASMQREYCYYEARYILALKNFVTQLANQGESGSDTTAALTITTDLNKRLNSLIEIMNYVGNERARQVNNRSPKINETNEKLKAQLETLKKQQNFLESSDVRIRTQEEMMRFSAEKSRAMNIQIMFFVALNVVALGMILTVYKGSAPK